MELHDLTVFTLLYLEVNVIALVLVGLIRYRTLGVSRMVAQRNFSMAIDSQMLLFLSDTLCILLETEVIRGSAPLLLAAKTVYFAATGLTCYFWFVYFEYLQDSSFTRNRRAMVYSSAPLWCMGAALLVNLFTRAFFFAESGSAYFRGPLFPLLYLFSYPYVVYASIHALIVARRRPHSTRRRLLMALGLFPVLPALAGIAQFYCPQLPLLCAALSVETLVLYFIWIDEIISLDPLTRLNNRKQLEYNYEQWRMNGNREDGLYLLLVDANKFKAINDTYGHSEGDAALVRIADAMRAGCRAYPQRSNIARYGGDEFVILAIADGMEEVGLLRNEIGDALKELNLLAKTPYDVSVSIGATRADPSLPLKELIARADEELYEEKRNRR